MAAIIGAVLALGKGLSGEDFFVFFQWSYPFPSLCGWYNSFLPHFRFEYHQFSLFPRHRQVRLPRQCLRTMEIPVPVVVLGWFFTIHQALLLLNGQLLAAFLRIRTHTQTPTDLASGAGCGPRQTMCPHSVRNQEQMFEF